MEIVKSFVLSVLAFAAACRPHPGYRVAAPERYEVGEEATLTIDAPGADPESPLDAELLVERPDGSQQRQPAHLTQERSRIKVGSGPTFMQTGRYRVSLVEAGKVIAPPVDIHINIDHLTELLADTIVEYKAKQRYAKSRAAGSLRWMQYSGVYEHPWQDNHEIEVTIEEPREAFKRAWAAYDEQGVVQVIQNNYVRLREGAETTMAAWTSRGLIIAVRAADLAQMDPKFLARFFARHPSDLKP
jgi:hypothetical protein